MKCKKSYASVTYNELVQRCNISTVIILEQTCEVALSLIKKEYFLFHEMDYGDM